MRTITTKHNRLFVTTTRLVVLGIAVVCLIFLIAITWIGYEVTAQCQHATKRYNHDCAVSLMQLVQDDTYGYRARNDAIWALGQLGDARALPVLQQYYTGVIPEREPLDQTLSQYELKKAIHLTSGGANLTAVFWRGWLVR